MAFITVPSRKDRLSDVRYSNSRTNITPKRRPESIGPSETLPIIVGIHRPWVAIHAQDMFPEHQYARQVNVSIANDPVRVRRPSMRRNSWPTSRLKSPPPVTAAGRSAFEVPNQAKDLSNQTVTLSLINAGIAVTFPFDPLDSIVKRICRDAIGL